MTLSMGDIKTASLQGNMGESERDVYGGLPPDARELLGVSADELIKLEGSVHGLRAAPKVWFQKVAADVKKLGAVQHPLGQGVFMFFPKATPGQHPQLLDAMGVYVSDFLF